MDKYSLTENELLDHLRDQIAFMQSSAESYDKGFEGEAKRLAVIIRILVHDTERSTSLLTLLHKKKTVFFYDTSAAYRPETIIVSFSGLLQQSIQISQTGQATAQYVAPLDFLPPDRKTDKKIGFGRWWERNIIIRDNKRNTFTRKEIVLTVADKEGGAHIDPTLNNAYTQLSRFNSLGWKFFKSDVTIDFGNNPALPSVRQIAHEVLKTLRDEFPSLFDN